MKFAHLVLAAVMLPAANAAVIYSGLQNIGVPQDATGIWIDLQTFATTTNPGATTNWDLHFYQNGSGQLVVDGVTNIQDDTFIFSTAGLVNLYQLNDTILYSGDGSHGSALSLTNFYGDTAYMGFICNCGDFNVTGWLQLSSGSPNGFPATIIDWAYNVELEQNIIAGDTTSDVPEPSTWGMMLSGIALVAVGARRRKRA